MSNTYGGKETSASNIAFSSFLGNSGLSDATPFKTLNKPDSVKNSKSFLPRKKSKSY